MAINLFLKIFIPIENGRKKKQKNSIFTFFLQDFQVEKAANKHVKQFHCKKHLYSSVAFVLLG